MLFTRIAYIYGLRRSDDKKIRYVGKTINPKGRIYEHKYKAIKSNIPTHKQKWIRKALKNGQNIELIILKICPLDEFMKWEEYYIKHFNSNNLTNSDKTGRGNSGRLREIVERSSKKLSKEVYQYDLSGQYIGCFQSTRDASRKLCISHGNISKCCNKIFQHTSGYVFRYNRCKVEELTNPNAIKKSVLEIDDNGNIINEWESIMECSRETKIDNGNISKCCNNKIKKTKGRFFKFKNNL